MSMRVFRFTAPQESVKTLALWAILGDFGIVLHTSGVQVRFSSILGLASRVWAAGFLMSVLAATLASKFAEHYLSIYLCIYLFIYLSIVEDRICWMHCTGVELLGSYEGRA